MTTRAGPVRVHRYNDSPGFSSMHQGRGASGSRNPSADESAGADDVVLA